MVFHGLLLIVVLLFSGSAFAPKPPPAVDKFGGAIKPEVQPTTGRGIEEPAPTKKPTPSPTATPTRHDGSHIVGAPPAPSRDLNPSGTPTLGGDPRVTPTDPRQPTNGPKTPAPTPPTKILQPPPSAGGQGGNGPDEATPTDQPTSQPTYLPTAQPTKQPTNQPTSQPTYLPTAQPTNQPTSQADQPTRLPTAHPTSQPTTHRPTSPPTAGHFWPPSILSPVSRPNADNINGNAPPTTNGKSPSPPTRAPTFRLSPVQKQGAGDSNQNVADTPSRPPPPTKAPSAAPTEGFAGLPTAAAPLGPTDQVAGEPRDNASFPPSGVVVHETEPTTGKPTSDNPDGGNALSEDKPPLDTASNPEPSDNTIPADRPTDPKAPIHGATGGAPVRNQVTFAPTIGLSGEGGGDQGPEQTPDTMGRPSSAVLPTPGSPTPDNGNPDNGNPDNGNPDNGNPGNPNNGPFGNGRPVSVIVRQRQGGIVRQPGVKTLPDDVLNAPGPDVDAEPADGATKDELEPASRGLSGGAIAGIVVGALVAVAGVSALAALAVNSYLSRPPSAVTAMSDEEVYYQMI